MQDLPFTPSTQATQGNTIKVTSAGASVAGSIDLRTFNANLIRVFNNGTIYVFVRISPEAQATIAATNTDVPIGPGRSILLQSPLPQGLNGVAVLASSGVSCDVYFTPGEGGAVEG